MPLRYFLLREIVFGQDGNFSFDALVGRYNSDLANGLGNLASRTLSMIHQYRDGVVPRRRGDQQFSTRSFFDKQAITYAYDKFDFSKALDIVWGQISYLDKYIVEVAPWKLSKKTDIESQNQLDTVLYDLAECLRIITVLSWPVIPSSAEKIWRQLGMEQPLTEVRLDDLRWGELVPGHKVNKGAPIFPRIQAEPAIKKMRELEIKETARQNALLGKKQPADEAAGTISIDEFAKVDLRVGEVRFAERVKGADKLLHIKVDIGESEPRTIVAGIAEVYDPDKLIGRKVVIVANLQPRKLRGIQSNGMIVAAIGEKDQPVLAGFSEDIPIGSRLR